MRVLHVIPSYHPALKYGGPIQSVHSLNKALASKGIGINVFTTNAGLENERDVPVNRWVGVDGVKVKYFEYYGYEHYTFSPKMFLGLLGGVENYGLIHITAVWNFPVLAGSVASALHKKPYMISPRGTINRETINIKSKIKKTFYYNLIARHYLRRASVIHFTTQDEKENVTGSLRLENKSTVVPNGLNLSDFNELPPKGLFRFKHPPLKGKKYILFLGRINIKKGLDILVGAFKRSARARDDLYLVIAGPDGEGYGEEVKKWLKDAGLLEKAVFTGMLTGRDKLEAFIDAEAFVLPSYSENFGMVVVEAMACGTPVVISNKVGICREVEQKRAGIIVEANSESLFKGIKILLDDEILRKEVAENGRRFAREYYDIDSVADMMIKTYEGIVKNDKETRRGIRLE